jgi:hypothetical protein
MTPLSKPISRESNTRSSRGRSLMIEIRPGSIDLVILREKGRRKGYAVPLEKIFQLGARLEADENRKIKALKRKAKK